MNQEEKKGLSEPKPRYVWDPKKLAWVETTEPEIREPATERAAVEPKPEEVVEEAKVEAKAEEVTGEAAAEGAPAAVIVEAVGPRYKGAGMRFVAFIVDLLAFLIISIVVGHLPGFSGVLLNTATGTKVAANISAWQQWVYIVIVTVYFVGFWTWRGQTPGKMVIGAKVVKTDGSPIGIRRAVLRFIVYFLYLMLWGFTGSSLGLLIAIVIGALIIIAFNKKRRGIHDFVAGTVVVDSRAPAPQPVEAEAVDVAEATETAELPGTSEPSEPSVASEPEKDKTEPEK